MVELNGDLLAVFNSFVSTDFDWAANHLPSNALIVIQIEGDDEFNQWAWSLAHKHSEVGQAIFPVQFRLKHNDHNDFEIHPAMFKTHRPAITGDLVY